MKFSWLSDSDIPKELLQLESFPLKIHERHLESDQNEPSGHIYIVPWSEISKATIKQDDYIIWLDTPDSFATDDYQSHKNLNNFLGTLGPFLEESLIYEILKSSQERKVKNLRQAEIIQKAKSQNLLIENQVKSLNSQVEHKTRQLSEYREELESQVSFEKDSILILRNLLEASSFESFAKVLINSFKAYFVQDLVLFYKQADSSYKIQSSSHRFKKQSFSLDQLMALDKIHWANISSKPVLEFKLFSIGTASDYFLGFEFSNFNLASLSLIQRHINYLQFIFKMVLDFLFDQEKIISDSLLWSTSFNSLDDPLLIIDEFYKIVKSNQEPELKGKSCFKVLFQRNEPCEGCPIKLSQQGQVKSAEKFTVNLEDKFNLHSFPVDIDESFSQKLWIHHYESTESINELRTQYIKSEKFSYLGQLVDKVIHQIANPLTGMRASTEYLLSDESQNLGGSLEDDLFEIQNGLVRCFEIINNLKDFSASEVNLSTTDLNSFVSKTLMLMKSVTRDIRFELVNLDDKKITCPTGLVQQVLFNLIYNSCQAMNFSGPIVISAEQDSSFTNLYVKDAGPGISPELKEKIFEPFFSTKSKDQGTGIGLFLSRQIIRQFGGDIVVVNSLSPGAELCIKFPSRIT